MTDVHDCAQLQMALYKSKMRLYKFRTGLANEGRRGAAEGLSARHLGHSQGKYCDRAFTFVPLSVSALHYTSRHDAKQPPNTHKHETTHQ